jgi:hypothetical protein
MKLKPHCPIALVLFVALLSTVFCAQDAAPTPQGRSFVEALPTNTVVVSPGHSATVQFMFRVQNPYHINSNQPTAEELIPTQIHFSLPGEVAVGKMTYPEGKLMSFPFDPSTKLSVYSGDFSIRGMIMAPVKAAQGIYTVHGELRYQACDNNACYPPKKLPFTFDVKIGPPGKARRG